MQQSITSIDLIDVQAVDSTNSGLDAGPAAYRTRRREFMRAAE